MRAIDADELLNPTDGLEHVKYSEEYGHVIPVCDIVYAPTIEVPDRNVGNLEPLTADEQRIFLAAMGREEKFCEQLDNDWLSVWGHDGVNLLTVCKEIERKVKKALWGGADNV